MSRRNKERDGFPSRALDNPSTGFPKDSIPIHIYGIAIALGLAIVHQFGIQRIFNGIRADALLPYGQIIANVSLDKVIQIAFVLIKLLLTFSVAALGGRVVVRLSGFTSLTPAEEMVLGLGTGLGCISILMFTVGMAGGFSPRLLFPLFLVLTLAAGIASITGPRARQASSASAKSASATVDLTLISCGLILAALIAINLIASLAPPVFYDTLVYHLALPDLYLLNSGLIPTPHNIYSGVPLNTEMLYTAALSIGGEKLAITVPLGLSVATMIAIFLCGLRYANANAGILAALLFYSCPILAGQVWFSLVEINWCFLGFITVFATLIHVSESKSSTKRCVFIGLLAGLTAGTKYNAIVILPIVALILLITHKRREAALTDVRPLFELIVIASVAMLALLPWLGRNWIWHGNPIFPFFSTTVDWRALIVDAQGRNLRELITKPGTSIDMLSTLWSMEWVGSAINEVGFPLLVLSSYLVFARRKDIGVQGLFITALSGWFFWAVSSRMPRFFLPTVPILALLIAISATSERHRTQVRNLLVLGIIIFCGMNTLKLSAYWYQSGSWETVIGKKTASTYLIAGQPGYFTPYFSAADYANRNLPAQSKILFFMESRGYYFKRNYMATSYFAENPLIRLADNASAPQDIRNALRADGFTHLFVNRAELFRRGAALPFSPHGTKMFGTFINTHLKIIFKDVVASPPAQPQDRRWVEIYEIM